MNSNLYNAFKDELRQWLADRGIKHYVLDGPVTDSYWSSPVRITVLNLETYGYEENEETEINLPLMEEWLKASLSGPTAKTARYTAVFVNALIRSLNRQPYDLIEQMRATSYDFETLIAALSKIAYTNIRKTSNPEVSQDVATIQAESSDEWAPLLKRQFEILNSHILLVGGKPGCDAINRIFGLEAVQALEFRGTVTLPNGTIIQSVPHFSRFDYEAAHQAIKNLTTCFHSKV